MTSRPTRLVSTQARGPEPAQVPRHERLRQVHVAHQVRDGAGAVGEALDDAQSRGMIESALWTTATSRRSCGGEVMVAIVERMRAGVGTGAWSLSDRLERKMEMHQHAFI